MLKKHSLPKNLGMRVGGQLAWLVLIGSRSVHPQELINRKAKDRKRKKAKIRDWLKKHGRTAKQVKKRKDWERERARYFRKSS